MPDYVIHYWPLPARGQFPRAILAQAGVDWEEAGMADVAEAKDADVADQAVPHMAPPMVLHRPSGTAMAQMPAVCLWLAEALDMMPASRAAALKVVCDANDVFDEVTLNGGREMWDADAWANYEPRLIRWMAIFDETGRRCGMTAGGGRLLGSATTDLADLASGVLWGTMADRLPRIDVLMAEHAPSLRAHAGRIMETPAIARLDAWSRETWGGAWCGGQIETSLRSALAVQE